MAARLPPGKFLAHAPLRGWLDHKTSVILEGIGQLINTKTSSETEPVTIRLVV
jgi:hypothetical protein